MISRKKIAVCMIALVSAGIIAMLKPTNIVEVESAAFMLEYQQDYAISSKSHVVLLKPKNLYPGDQTGIQREEQLVGDVSLDKHLQVEFSTLD